MCRIATRPSSILPICGALESAEFLPLKFINAEATIVTQVVDYIHRIEEGGGCRGDGKYLDLLIVACVAITHRRGSAMNLISSYVQNNAPLHSNSTLHKHYDRLLKKGQIPDSILNGWITISLSSGLAQFKPVISSTNSFLLFWVLNVWIIFQPIILIPKRLNQFHCSDLLPLCFSIPTTSFSSPKNYWHSVLSK